MDFDERINNPARFVLTNDKLAIGVIDREYGIICMHCGGKEFSEDESLSKIICSNCKKVLAIRATLEDTGWVIDKEEEDNES